MIGEVTFAGDEVGLVIGLIARALPVLDQGDYEVADLMLDKALAAMPGPLEPQLAALIEVLRVSPRDRALARLNTKENPS